MKTQTPYILTLLLLLIPVGMISQDIILKNPSFEGETGDDRVPPNWENCYNRSTPDIQPGFWGVTQAPRNGSTYMGLTCRFDRTYEGITQRFAPQQMSKEKSYGFSFYLAYSRRPDPPARVRVFLSRNQCDNDQLIWTSPVISHEYWEKYTVVFSPERSDYEYLLIEAYYIDSSLAEGYVLIDHIVGINEVVPVEGQLGQDTTLCEGDSLVLYAPDHNRVHYWNDGNKEDSLVVTEPGTYWLAVEFDRLLLTDTVHVDFTSPPSVDLGNDTTRCLADPLTWELELPDADRIIWMDNATEGPVYTAYETGNYWVTIIQGACVVYDDINLTFLDCEHNVVMPNLFSPNGDGANETFVPISIRNASNWNMTIYDRWGVQCYRGRDPQDGWDARNYAEGTYYWVLQYTGPRGGRYTKKGYVVVMR